MLARAALFKANVPDAKHEEREVDRQSLDTVKIQFLALGLIVAQQLKTVGAGMAMFWSATDKGRSTILELRSVNA